MTIYICVGRQIYITTSFDFCKILTIEYFYYT